jgi:hypothetical protein
MKRIGMNPLGVMERIVMKRKELIMKSRIELNVGRSIRRWNVFDPIEVLEGMLKTTRTRSLGNDSLRNEHEE